MADGKRCRVPLEAALEVKVVGGERYNLEKLPKIKSGLRRRSFKRKPTQNRQDSGFTSLESSSEEAVHCSKNNETVHSYEENTQLTIEDVSSDQNVWVVPLHNAYLMEVCKGNALVPVSISLNSFALQDFDEVKGQLQVFCVGFNYGFEVMQTRESPNVPFTIFVTRFPKGCSSGYDLNMYPQLGYINSQVNEQANSVLQRFRAQLGFMTQDNFMKHCRFILWFMNRRSFQRNNLYKE